MKPNRSNVLKPPEILKGDVECFILNTFTSADGTAVHVFPSGVPGLVFHHNAGRPAIESITMQSGRTSFPPTLFLYGPGTEASVMNFRKGAYTVIQVIFRPYALKALFGLNALTLKQCTVELNEFSGEDIDGQLLDAKNEHEQVTLLTSFLIDKLKQANTRDALIEESLHIIHRSAGAITVKDLLEYMDISERQFERRFSQTVGIPPLAYIRVRRFNEAMRLIKARQYATLTDVAYALNFHDQAHFIREIKTFTGVTPKNLSQNLDDFYHNQANYSYD